MKRLLVRDDDEDLFDVPLQPILYNYYKENTKEIRRMVKQQGAGFWIQFVTSFRSFISNSGSGRTDECECCEEAFIDMLKITAVNSFTEFVSLIESLFALHVLLFSSYGRFVTGANITTARVMSGFHKPLHTFRNYSRFVCAVVVLYQRWTRAPKVRARTPPAKWIPPAHWSQQNGRGPRAYECYLYDIWGNALCRMIGVDKEVMKFFKPQKGDNSTCTSSSNNQNNLSNVYATEQKKTRKRRRRNRNKNKNGGVTKPSGTLNEDGSSVERTIAGDSNSAQSDTVGQKNEEKRKTDAALATSSETESADTFQYDHLFKVTSRKRNVDSSGNNMKEAGDQESGMSSYAAGEASSTANGMRKDATLKYEKLFKSKDKGPVSGHTDSVSAANDKQKERTHLPAKTELPNMSSPEHKGPSSCHRKTADSFRDERLFTFSGKINKVHSGGVDLNDEMDANPAVHNSHKKGAVYHPTDKQFTTNRDTAKETKERGFFRYDRLFNLRTRKQNAPASTDNRAGTNKRKEKDFFRYDRLFNFSTPKQNTPENADNKSTTNKTEEKESFRYDKLFNFSTQKQNAPENADKKSTTNKTEKKDFFRYDRLFSFSKGKQNATDSTDEISISSDEWENESETLDDDYTASHKFCGGFFGGPFQHEPHKKKMSQPVREYLMQKCSNCNILEKYPGMYKACRMCMNEGVQAPKVYCGEHCGRTHWRKQHHTDHKTFGNKYTTFRM